MTLRVPSCRALRMCRRQGGDNLSGQVSILGAIIMTGDSTGFEGINDEDLDGEDFFAAVDNGDLVAFRDADNNGVAEEVEFED